MSISQRRAVTAGFQQGWVCTVVLVALAHGLLVARLVAQVEPLAAILEAEAARIETIESAAAATIAVFQSGGQGGGSGVIISPDGFALTNFHVTDMGPALECGLADGSVAAAVIVGIDPTGDVALIKLVGRDDFPTAPLGDSDLVRPGQWVFAAGNPFLLADSFRPSISYGIVSGTNRYQYPSGTLLEYADCIQTDAAINPGNSGGPLFNMQGEVIGVNGRASFEKRGRVNVGVGYAISINQIKRFIGYLKSGRIVDHATLGATVTSGPDGSVVVDDILETSDAYRRGLRYDDQIVRLGDRDITTVNGFKNALGTYPKGWRIPLTYRRDGKTFDVYVRLAGAHREGALAERLSRSPSPQPGEPGPDPDAPPPRLPDLPLPGLSDSEKLPPEIESLFEARRGFANYYFNRKYLSELFQRMPRIADEDTSSDVWILRGRVVGGGEFSVTLGPESGQMVLPLGQFEALFGASGELTENLSPPGSGGLLGALHLWQRLLRVGPHRFGEVVYRGTMPLAAQEEWVHVVDATYGGVEVQLAFQPKTGQLIGMEMFADPVWDPCEIIFSDYRTVDGRTLPYHIEVRNGNQIFVILEVELIDFQLSKPLTSPRAPDDGNQEAGDA